MLVISVEIAHVWLLGSLMFGDFFVNLHMLASQEPDCLCFLMYLLGSCTFLASGELGTSLENCTFLS